jgi:hypothetical protein
MTAAASTTLREYSDREHRYFADGREYRSVTQILNAAGLISEYCRDEEARWRGTEVHDICATDDIETVDLRTIDSRLRGYVKAWRQYRADTGFTPTLIEHRVDCDEFRYAGRFDRIGMFPNGQKLLTIIDLKTAKSGAIPKYARLQLVAYGHAFNPTQIFGRITVSLKPDGRYNTMPYPLESYQADKAEWLGMVRKTEEENSNGHS